MAAPVGARQVDFTGGVKVHCLYDGRQPVHLRPNRILLHGVLPAAQAR